MISDIEKEDIATANYKDGFDEGMEKGKSQQAVEIARRMLEDNMPIGIVAKYSGLTEEQIKAL